MRSVVDGRSNSSGSFELAFDSEAGPTVTNLVDFSNEDKDGMGESPQSPQKMRKLTPRLENEEAQHLAERLHDLNMKYEMERELRQRAEEEHQEMHAKLMQAELTEQHSKETSLRANDDWKQHRRSFMMDIVLKVVCSTAAMCSPSN